MKLVSYHQRPLNLMLASVAVLGLQGPASAADSSASAPGVAKLLARSPTTEPPGMASAPPARPTVTVLRGENLDRVMRRVLPKLPFNDEFMRQAFVLVNPDLLGNNPARALPTGAALVVPTPQDLGQLLHAQYPVLSSTPGASPTPARNTLPPAPESDTGNARRAWVRYP